MSTREQKELGWDKKKKRKCWLKKYCIESSENGWDQREMKWRELAQIRQMKKEGDMNKWWRKEDNYLRGSRCRPVSPGWGESSGEGREEERANGEVRSRRLGGASQTTTTTTRGHKTGAAKVPFSHTNGCSAMLIKVPQLQRGTKNTIMQLSWPDTLVFLLPVIQCKQKSLSRIKIGYVCVCVRLCVQSHL